MQAYFGQDGICHETDPSRITDELREKLSEYKPQEIGDKFIAHPIGEVGYDIMMALCDAIDAVHANLERENAELKAEHERKVGCTADEWAKDADGEYIRVGDELRDEWNEQNQGKVEWLMLDHDGWWLKLDSSCERFYVHEFHEWRHCHYQPPTVEDVLREFADIVRKERVELATISEDTIAEYAEKLREVMAE